MNNVKCLLVLLLACDGSTSAPDASSIPDAVSTDGASHDVGADAAPDAPGDSSTADGSSPSDGGEPLRPKGVVFETNFESDGDYFRTGDNLWNHTDVPAGWDGVRTNAGTISGVPGGGIGGSVAMKFEWPATTTPLATSLGKHLTGDPSTGFDELYIRYHVRLPETFTAGSDGQPLPYWKWGRLWQNTGVASGWTENRPDSYFIVWNWGSGLPRWGIRNGLTFGENLGTNDRGSAGSPRAGPEWYVSGSDSPGHHVGFDGHWDNVGAGAWEFDHSSRELLDHAQGWHTFEWRFKLSSSDTANDGVFQVWFDGEEQLCPNPIDGIDQSIDRPSTTSSLITAAKPGFNMLIVMDNMSEWSRQWADPGVEGGIYINDIVVSTDRIGHDYVAGNTY
jgi:hypothetical protein